MSGATALGRCDEAVDHLVFHPSGRMLVTGDAAGEVRWTALGGAGPEELARTRLDGAVTALAVDDAHLAIGSDGGTVVVVDSHGSSVDHRTREPVTALAWQPSHEQPGTGPLLAVAATHDVLVLDPAGDVVVSEMHRRGSATCCAWLHETTLAVGGSGGVSFIGVDGPALGPPPGFEAMPDLLSPGVVLWMDLDVDRSRLTVGDLRGEVRITDLVTGDELSVDGFGDAVRHLCWWAGSELLAVAAEEQISIWTAAPHDLEPEPALVGPFSGPSVGPVPSPAGDRLAVGDRDGCVWLLGRTAPHEPVCAASLTSEITALCWSPDGSRLAVGSLDGDVRVVDLETTS